MDQQPRRNILTLLIDWIFDAVFYGFDKLIEVVDRFGRLLFALALDVGPWAAPLAPATLSYQHLTGPEMGFSTLSAAVVAVAIECVGLASAGTLITVIMHNKSNRASRDQIPERPVYWIFGAYLLTVISLNVALQFAVSLDVLIDGGARTGAVVLALVIIIVQALLVLLGLPASAVIGYRATYRQVIQQIEGRQHAGNMPAGTGNNYTVGGNVPQNAYTDFRQLPVTELRRVAKMSPRQIAEDPKYQIKPRASRDWPKRATKELKKRGLI